jgi:hypothetical protein
MREIKTFDEAFYRREYCWAVRNHECVNGVYFTSKLASRAGANFTLFWEPHHTKDDIEEAVRKLRGLRDVVSVYYVLWNPEPCPAQ